MTSHSELDDLLAQHAASRGRAQAAWMRWDEDIHVTLRELHRRHHDTTDVYFGRVTLAAAQRVIKARHGLEVTTNHIETWARACLGVSRWSDSGGA